LTATRALILLIVGAFMGAVLTFMGISTLERRHAVPSANMKLMQYHLGQTRKTARSTTCDATAAERHLRRVGELARDADAIFTTAGYAADEFAQYREPFSTELDKGLAGGPDCAAISVALKPIADACESCHHALK